MGKPYVYDLPYLEDIAKYGMYGRETVSQNSFDYFARFGYLDPYTVVENTREYLFFIKPDLHIMEGKSGLLNPELENSPFFIELLDRYPYVINWLQASSSYDPCPFIIPLTGMCKSNLDLPDISASNMETPTNIFGTNYEYRGSGEASDDNYSFSLEFYDTKYLEIYMFFRAYEEYERLKKLGVVTPPDDSYTTEGILHDQIGIFKLIVGVDMYTIVYYAYLCGVIPNTVPRSTFSNLSNGDIQISMSVDFKAAFVDDSGDPLILRDFNDLIMPLYSTTTREAPIYNRETNNINGTWVKCPYIYTNRNTTFDYYGRKKYELRWRI